MLLPCFTNLVPVSDTKFKLLRKLISAASGESNTKNQTNSDDKRMFSLNDVQGTKENSNTGSCSSWIKQESKYWQKEKLFKTFGNETWESLWLESSCEWKSGNYSIYILLTALFKLTHTMY